ncbi:RIP metalloprotease RseP [Ferviditalea candida]|uniref:Zinc metalloprotease n=1 Tax=Ferviditalea candida TaxID=3108399 RepID=A0ABU5ZF47_9BACL|nr:RIP metalloprotease RseP [Paenibacillaceae bacterium T2]
MFSPQVIFLTVLVFFLLVGIHEFGHFYFARRAGILVREFAIGFGPKLFSYRKNETRYTIRLLPLGGYVRMAGEDPEVVSVNPGQSVALKVQDGQVTRLFVDQLDMRTDVYRGIVDSLDLEKKLRITLEAEGSLLSFPVHPQAQIVSKGTETQIAPLNRQFGSKTVGQRAMAIFAGPMMNFLLAFILFLIFSWMTGIPEHVQLSKVLPNSAAAAAKLQPNDVILSIEGKSIGADTEKMIQMISSSAGKEMVWQVRRGDAVQLVNITPQDQNGRGMVGIEIRLLSRKASPLEIVQGAGESMAFFTQEIFKGLQKLVSLQVKMDDLGGPVRMVEVTGQVANMGIVYLVKWAALLSLYLGIFNLLPFPALDGSRLIFIGIEALRGKPVDPARESMVHFIGFAMLMLLMLAVTYNDILRLFKG